MYAVERNAKDVVISGPRGKVIYTTSQDSFIVFKEGEGLVVKQVKDLNDGDLVLALAKAVRIITDNGQDT